MGSHGYPGLMSLQQESRQVFGDLQQVGASMFEYLVLQYCTTYKRPQRVQLATMQNLITTYDDWLFCEGASMVGWGNFYL